MLPTIDAPTFKVTLPSLKREILLRPFLVKEEKILLLAKQSKDKDQIFLSLKQVIQNCIVDKDIDVSKLPYYDIEFLFIQLRINSIGDAVEVEVTDPDTDKRVKATVSLSDVNVKIPSTNNNVKIGDETALIMRHPTIDEISKVSTDSNIDSFFDMLKYSIKSVFHNDQNYEFDSYPDNEKVDFIDSLSVESIETLKGYISKMPSVEVEANWTMADGTTKSQTIRGMSSFF